MRQLSIWLVGLAMFGLVERSALGQAPTDDPRRAAAPPGTSFSNLDGRKVVLVVNGAGDSRALSDHLTELNEDHNLRLVIHAVNWSQHEARVADYVDHRAHLNAATKLAVIAKQVRRDAHGADIYLVGHDAGARIALVAAEMLPERTVNRIILIAPGVSSNYDLRPAFRASRSGIDSFWSPEDDFLERMSEVRGNADGTKGPAAGRIGFRTPLGVELKDVRAYCCNIRQYRYSDAVAGAGGHYTWLLKITMKRFGVPLFCQPDIVCQVGAPPVAPVVPTPLPPPYPQGPAPMTLPLPVPMTPPPAELTPASLVGPRFSSLKARR